MEATASPLDAAVLVLNSGWAVVHMAPVRRAISLVYRGLAEVVNPDDFGTYDFEMWKGLSCGDDNGCIRTVNFKLRVPEIIRLSFFNGRKLRKIRFTRRNIFERDNYSCQYCGERLPARDLTLDHVVPRSRGGRSTWQNLVVACNRCNDRKASRLPRETDMSLLRTPRKPRGAAYLSMCSESARRPSWKRFLDSASWDSELGE